MIEAQADQSFETIAKKAFKNGIRSWDSLPNLDRRFFIADWIDREGYIEMLRDSAVLQLIIDAYDDPGSVPAIGCADIGRAACDTFAKHAQAQFDRLMIRYTAAALED